MSQPLPLPREAQIGILRGGQTLLQSTLDKFYTYKR